MLKPMTAVAAALFSIAALPTSSHAQSIHDGQWLVTILTQTGSCEATLSFPVTVSDGRISATGADDVTGKVSSAGLIKVSLRGAYANGQLSGNTGTGKWNGAAAGIPCSGRWEAKRL